MSLNNHPTVRRHPGERRAKLVWVSLVVLLLGLQVVIGGVAIYLATGDPSVSVVPNYHYAALNWDAVHRAQGAIDRRGWTLRVEAMNVVDAEGRRAVVAELRDREGAPVDGLEITATVYHHARASETRAVTLQASGEGRYLATVPMQRPGLWEVMLAIDGADEPMRQSTTLELE